MSSIMLAGLKAVRQRRRVRSTTPTSTRRGSNDNSIYEYDDDDIGFDTSQFLVHHDDTGDDLYPEDESPMITTQDRKHENNNTHTGSISTSHNKSYISSGAATGSTTNTTTITSAINEDANEEDEIITAGNEALLFIYGHNVNLYTDIFHLPSSAYRQCNREGNHEIHSLLLLEQVNRSYNEQMHYLNQTNVTLAMQYFRCRHSINSSNKSNGKYAHVMNTMDPKTFLDIQKDALHRAYTILMHDESRNEYDELLRLHNQDILEEEDTGVAAHSDEENVIGTPSGSACEEADHEEEYSDDESDILTVQTTADDDDDDEEEEGGDYDDEDDEGRIRSKANQRSSLVTPAKYQEQQQYSPTDPMEFDMLIHDSLVDGEYYSQLYRDAKTIEMEGKTKVIEDTDDVLFFDPFNLQGDDKISNEYESHRVLFPEKAIPSKEFYEHDDEDANEDEDENTNEDTTMSSFICPLPSSEGEDEEDEITMGRLIELQEKMASTKKNSLYLDDVLKSSSSDDIDSEDDEDDENYEDSDEAMDSAYEDTAKEQNDESVISCTIDDGSVITKTKNYFVDDISKSASLPKQACNDSAASVATSTASTSSWTSNRSSNAPKKESEKTSRRKLLKAKVRSLVKTIGSKSKLSTPSSEDVDGDKFPEQEVYGTSSNNSIGSRMSGLAVETIHPKMIESSSFDPNGLKLSRSAQDSTSSSVLVSDEQDEVAEIENLLSIASTFSAMDAAADIAERVRNRKSSRPNNILDEEGGSIECFSTDDDYNIHRNCRRRRRHLSRFETDDELILDEEEDECDEDEDEYSQSAEGHGWSSSPPSSQSRGVFAFCIDGVGSSIDKTLDSVERVFAC